jgi:hypothetical protein
MEKGMREGEPSNLRLVDTERAIETELRPEVRKLFDIIIRENPELSATKIETFYPVDIYDAGGYYTLEEIDGEITPVIHISAGGPADYRPLMEIRKASVEINAETLGIDMEDMTPELLELFILAHEMGHVQDFVSNYQRDPDLDGWGAPEEMAFHRHFILGTLPIPHISPTGVTGHMRDVTSLDEVLKIEPRLAKHPRFNEINTVEDLIRVQEEEYRASEPERYADAFAAAFLNKHSKELGLSLHEGTPVQAAEAA